MTLLYSSEGLRHGCIARQSKSGLLVFEQQYILSAQVLAELSANVSQGAQEAEDVLGSNRNATLAGLKPDAAETSANSKPVVHKVQFVKMKQCLLAAARLHTRVCSSLQ